MIKLLHRGMLVELDVRRTGNTLVVALMEQSDRAWWKCLVVKSDGNPAYGVGGYDLSIHSDDLRAGEQVKLDDPRSGLYITDDVEAEIIATLSSP